MGDATTLLFGLGGFRVVSVSSEQQDGQELERHVVVEGLGCEQACPDWGVFSGSVHSWSTSMVQAQGRSVDRPTT